MAQFWQLETGYQEEFSSHFPSLDATLAVEGKKISQDPRCRVFRVQIGERIFYLKKFHRNGKLWRHQYSPSRVLTEWRSLNYFRQWGIPTPPLVAFGQERHFGKFIRGVLVTEAIYGAYDLEHLARAGDPVVRDYKVFRKLAQKVAGYTRTMHQHGFAHNDLDWRNILVVSGEDPQPYFFDAPCGRFWSWPFLSFRIFKDLAHLDEIAREVISPKWRLYFYHCYTGRKRLDQKDKALIRRIIKYYEGR